MNFLTHFWKFAGLNFLGSEELLIENGMLASSLRAKVLIVDFDAMGKGNGTSCASIPSVAGMEVEKGSFGGAVGALGIGGLPTLCVPTLELLAF